MKSKLFAIIGMLAATTFAEDYTIQSFSGEEVGTPDQYIDAEFGGSDDAGSTVVEEVNSSYESWATPVLEILIGGELPGEVESLFFCIQTGIGVGIMAFLMGRFVERKKWMKDES